MAELVFVKWGGSVITDKQQTATPRLEVIRSLAMQTRAALDACPDLNLVLGHGSGSFGHVVGHRYQVHRGMADDGPWHGYAQTGTAAARLNRIVADGCEQAGLAVLTLQPSAMARCRAGALIEMNTWPLSEALRHRLMPLVYGDVAFDDLQGCTIISTETIFAFLARTLRPQRIILVGQVDGVYERDPLQDALARPIARLLPQDWPQIQAQLGGSHGLDVTGGMLTKVRMMMDLVAQGHTGQVRLISGLRQGALQQALLDPASTAGTVIEQDM